MTCAGRYCTTSLARLLPRNLPRFCKAYHRSSVDWSSRKGLQTAYTVSSGAEKKYASCAWNQLPKHMASNNGKAVQRRAVRAMYNNIMRITLHLQPSCSLDWTRTHYRSVTTGVCLGRCILKRIQRQAARMVSNIPRTDWVTSITGISKELGWKPL